MSLAPIQQHYPPPPQKKNSCKHTRLRRFPQYEISLLFLCAWGSYAFAEALSLSGVMALFVSGVVLGHYNSYNLSKKSQVCVGGGGWCLCWILYHIMDVYLSKTRAVVDHL